MLSKFYISVFLSLFLLIYSNAQIVFLDEHFDNCELPDDFFLLSFGGGSTNPGNCNNSLFSFECNTVPFSNVSPQGDAGGLFDGCIATIDDDAAGQYHDGYEDDIRTYYFNTSYTSSLTLSFDYEFKSLNNLSEFKVGIYHDGQWDNPFITSQDGYGHVIIDISSSAAENMLINFWHDDNGYWAWGVSIDNVKLEGECDHPDYNALMALYNSTDGDNWYNNNGWGTTCNPCSWYGITCDANDNVVRVILNDNNLTGEIPTEIGDLTFLKELDLFENNLSGEIPSTIGNLYYLEWLNCRNNNLSGQIPHELGDLVYLENFNFGNNLLTGNIPSELGNLNNLLYLVLNNNQLSGEIPSELGNLSELSYLDMRINDVSGEIPPELGLLSNLLFLNLSVNSLTGEIPPELGNLTNINWMGLDSNSLEGEIPPELGNLDYLEDLYLLHNNLSGCFDPNLSNLCYVPNLDFSNNQGLPGGGDFEAFCSTGFGEGPQPPANDPILNDICYNEALDYDLTQHDDFVSDNAIGVTVKWYDGNPDDNGLEIDNPVSVNLTEINDLWALTENENGGCTNKVDVTVNILEEILPNLTSTDETGYNKNDGTCTTNTTGGTSPYFYIWSTGDTTKTIDSLSPGLYTITVTDVLGCKGIQSDSIHEYKCTNIDIEITVTDETGNNKNDGKCTANPAGGTAPYFYIWSTGDTTKTIDSLSPGTYTVTVTDTLGCGGMQTDTVHEYECPNIDIEIITTDETGNDKNDGICTVNPTGGTAPYFYIWSTGDTTKTIDSLPPGIYTVTVTDINQCKNIQLDTIKKFICPDLKVEVTLKNLVCYGDCQGMIRINGIVNGVPPYSYHWSDNKNGYSIDNLCAGDYFVTITDNKNCTISDSFKITQPEEIIINLSKRDASACGTSDGSVTASISGGIQPYTCKWNNGKKTRKIENIKAGTYFITVTDSIGCVKIDTIVVENKGGFSSTIYATPSELCQGDTSTLIASPLGDNATYPFNYKWNNGSKKDTIMVYPSETSSYTVTITDANQCISIASIDLIVNDNPQIVSINVIDSKCDQYNGSIKIGATSGTPPYQYKWSNGGNKNIISDLKSGEYTVSVTDSIGCNVIKKIIIKNIPGQITTLTTDESIICQNDSITLNASSKGGTGQILYFWNSGDGTDSIITVTPLSSKVYQVISKDENNCKDTASVEIEVLPVPSPNLILASDSFCKNQQGIFIKDINFFTENEHNIYWDLDQNIGTILYSDNRMPYAYFNINKDISQGNYSISYVDTIIYSEKTCTSGWIEKSFTVSDNTAPDKVKIYRWPGQIYATSTNEDNICTQWGYNKVTDNKLEEDILLDNNKYLYAMTFSDININSLKNKTSYLWADIYEKSTNDCKKSYDSAECITRIYFNVDDLPPLDTRSKMNNNLISIFPNPTSKDVNISIEGIDIGFYDIEIFSPLGIRLDNIKFDKTLVKQTLKYRLNKFKEYHWLVVKITDKNNEFQIFKILLNN